jgi:Zn-dependent peptidase ImmA (M78 family)/DNA-binding XRE family transcriptional regulator
LRDIPRARTNPSLLVWARESSFYSVQEAARKIGVKSETLQLWESGQLLPTMNQLRAIGRVYRRPSALFFARDVPEKRPKIADFRLLPGIDRPDSPELEFEIRRAYERRDVVLDLARQSGDSIPVHSISAQASEKREVIARRLREVLGISLATQLAWHDERTALSAWIQAVESLGVLVFQTSRVHTEQMRGFSIAEYPFPVIVLNGSDSVRGRVFTLIHELVHLTLRTGGLCNLREGPDVSPLEILCNYVAGEILVPRDALLSQLHLLGHNDDPEWQDWELTRLANRFMTSREVVLRRLLILNRTTVEFYQQKHEEYSRVVPRHESRRGPKYHIMVLRNNGIAYTGRLLEAYRNNMISLSELSRHLGGIRLNHIEPLENALIRRREGVHA